MIELKNIDKTLGGKKVIDNLSFVFQKGKAYCIIGPNGSGKTTLMNIIIGVVLPDHGHISIDHNTNNPRIANTSVAVTLPGDRGLHWRCTARQNYEYFLGLKGIGKKEVNRRILHNEALFGQAFQELIDKRIETMSFGQKKKVSIFLSLLSGADYLFFDEITEGIDIDSREQILHISEVMRKKNKTLIYTTHDIAFAKAVSDEALFLKDGALQSVVKIHDETDVLAIYKSIGR